MRQKKQRGGGGGANWMDTYGDLVTLLLCFFVMLFASSTMSEEKWIAIVESFRGMPTGSVIEPIEVKAPTQGLSQNNVVTRSQSQIDISKMSQQEIKEMLQQMLEDSKSNAQKKVDQEFDQLYENLNAYIKEQGLSSSLMLTKDGMYITITILDGILFDSGSANIRDEQAQNILTSISDMAASYSDAIQHVTVEGHTDNNPINTAEFTDNFDLSSKRANNVVRYMIQASGMAPSMFDSLGRGEWIPIATNETTEGRQKNRRVNIILTAKDVDGLLTDLQNAEANVAAVPQPAAVLTTQQSNIVQPNAAAAN